MGLGVYSDVGCQLGKEQDSIITLGWTQFRVGQPQTGVKPRCPAWTGTSQVQRSAKT